MALKIAQYNSGSSKAKITRNTNIAQVLSAGGGLIPGDEDTDFCSYCTDVVVDTPKYITVFLSGIQQETGCIVHVPTNRSSTFTGSWPTLLNRGWSMMQRPLFPCTWALFFNVSELSEFTGTAYRFSQICDIITEGPIPLETDSIARSGVDVTITVGNTIRVRYIFYGELTTGFSWNVSDDIFPRISADAGCLECSDDFIKTEGGIFSPCFGGSFVVREYVLPWISGTKYYSGFQSYGECVVLDNSVYSCILKHTATGVNKPPNSTYWAFRDHYDPCWNAVSWVTATAYIIGDRVSNDGICYYCILGHTSSGANEPPNVTYWGTWT